MRLLASRVPQVRQLSNFARHTKAPPVRAWRDSSVPLKELAEECDILITHGIANFLHAPMVAFQQSLGRGDPQFLYVKQRRVSSGLLETANEIALAHAHAARRHFERERTMEVFVKPLLGAGDRAIAMLGFQG